MKIPRLKFIWGGARQIRGRWYLGLFGFYDRVQGQRDSGLAVSVRGILGWAAAATVAAYLAGAAALWWLWERNPYSTLTYADALLYPVRRSEISAKKGRAFIAQGMDLWTERKLADAANMLRHGLARYPHDRRARMTLAEFYVLANRRPLALETLAGGLTEAYPGRAYLERYFAVAEQMEEFEAIVAACGRYAAQLAEEEGWRDRRWLEERQFRALMAAERFADALAAAEAGGTGDSARERRVLALLALGRAADAVEYLAGWEAQPGASLQVVRRLQVRAFREAKRFAEMDEAIADLRQLSPAAPGPAVYGVVQQALAGRMEAANAAADDFIFRFGGMPANLLMLAEPVAEIGALTLFEKCAGAAAERGHPAKNYAMLRVRTLVREGEWEQAAAALATMELPGTGREAESDRLWLEWMRRLVEAAVAPTPAAQVRIVELMRERPWPAAFYRQTIEALRRADRMETVRDVTAVASAAFPTSEWLQLQGAEVSRELAARAGATSLVPPAASRVWTESEFFARLEQLLASAQWDEANEMILDAREAQPPLPWLASRDAETRLAQIRIGHGRDRTSEMLVAARLYLNGDDNRSATILGLARDIHRTDPVRAVELVREVRRKSPDYPPAERLLAEWQPRPKR